ncbi:hypothetical protein DdX_08602 [Ditylenchus destructor]|uniref:Uncharacterized protein n=1 Tax=Ditylenchus destructor TaxID=166010 RepID=A0AAD4N2B3_9BILA|nr:hypothetical protein DdX_08602 [Ditylenchus destructor]
MLKQNVAHENKENVAVPGIAPFDSSVRGSASGHGRGSHTGGYQSGYGQKTQDPPRRQEGHDFGDTTSTVQPFGNYPRGNIVRGPSRGGMNHGVNTENRKETPVFQDSGLVQDVNQNIITRGDRGGRGYGGSIQKEAFSVYNEPSAVSETAKEAPVMQPPSPQNVVPRGGISNARGSRGGRGGIHYGEDVSERVEPPVVSETVKEAPAPKITTHVQEVSQNGVARGGFGTSRGGTVRGGLNRGEDLSGSTPTADAGYGRPLTLPQAQSGEKHEGSSNKVHPWHTSTSVAQIPVAQPSPATENGGSLKNAVPQGDVKDDGVSIRISNEDFAKLAQKLKEMTTSFNGLNDLVQLLVKKGE